MEPINFNKARKARAKSQAKLDAVANRAKFGRTKTERAAERLEIERNVRSLDGARIDRRATPAPPETED